MSSKSSKERILESLVDYNDIVEVFHDESDRAAGILAASFLESYLEKVLRYFMNDSSIVDELFKNNGPLSTFSSRCNICLAFGIINERLHKNLDQIRKIRNYFAHHPQKVSFDESPIRDHCDHLSTAQLGKSRREAFLFAVGLTVGEIHNAILRHASQEP